MSKLRFNLPSFKTFCKKELTIAEIKNQILNENKFIIEINLFNNDIQIHIKSINEPYSIVEYFKKIQ